MKTEVLKFYATWCGPCKILSSRLEGVEGITEIDIEKNMELAREYHVRNVPLLVFLVDGKEVYRSVGLMSKNGYDAKLKEINDSKELKEIDVVDEEVVKPEE
jgi:thiol-disulfide isomerase/thioredoxin